MSKPSIFKKLLPPFLVLMLCLLVLFGFWFLSKLGPNEVSYEDALLDTDFVLPLEMEEKLKRSEALELKFEEIVSLRAPDPEAIALIREAMELQKEYVEALPGYDVSAKERYDQLRVKYQNLEADQLLQKSRELEFEADDLREADAAYTEIEKKYSAAFDLQKKINEDYPLSKAYNPSRAAFLQRQLTYTSAEPMRRQSEQYESEADSLIKSEAWTQAEAKIMQAIELQEAVNVDFRTSSQASVPRAENLKLKLLKIRSGDKFIQIESIIALADQARASGEMLKAASLYDEALRLQKKLNEDFPNSPYASSQNLVEYERKSQTAQSYSLGLEIEENHDILRKLLADRRILEAVEVIVNLQRGMRQMNEAFPKSSLNNEELQVKVRFLSLLQADLGFIQERMYASLLPIDGVENWSLLKTEVTQALYSLLMGTNPSRNLGDQKPVDSVSWVEAKRFCERLSWVMGKEVRLPTEYEFRQSVGALRYLVLEDYVWSAADNKLEAQEVAQKKPLPSGAYDLLGNVSEWLEVEDRFIVDEATHIGGSIQDTLENIFTIPSNSLTRSSRNRSIGFRVVVSVSTESPE